MENVIAILASLPLTDTQHEQVIEDTLASPLAAKRAWPESGMHLDITERTSQVKIPVCVIIGENDMVETEPALRAAFDEFYPGTKYFVIPRTGHLSPLEAPGDVVEAIRTALED